MNEIGNGRKKQDYLDQQDDSRLVKEKVQAAEVAVERDHNLFLTLIDNLPDSIYVKNRDSRFLIANAELARRFGAEAPSEIIGKTDFDFLPESLAEQYHAEEQEIIRTGKPIVNREGCIIDKRTGQRKWILSSKVPLLDRNANVTGIVGVGRDITEHMLAREAERNAREQLIEHQRLEKEHVECELAKVRDELVRKTRLAAIGQVSGSIAHDIRNPLSIVRNSVFYLKRRLKDAEPKVVQYLEIIDQEVSKAAQIITNMLQMTRAKPPNISNLDLGKIVRELCNQMKCSEQIRFEISMEPDPFIVHGDPDQLKQVFTNLISNASEAMGGHGVIFVEGTCDSDCYSVVFRDTGPGIALEIKETLFEPLVTSKQGGTGFGLTICREIIDRHGGTIDAENCEGQGAAVRILLPRQ